MNLNDFDMKLLPVLRALLEERSVTRAARRVGLTEERSVTRAARRVGLTSNGPVPPPSGCGC